MSEPVLLLNMDQLSKQFSTRICQVGVKRDAELDGLALHYNSPTDSGAAGRIRSRRRKIPLLAYPFNQVRRNEAFTLGKTRKWTSASDQDGSERTSDNICQQGGCEQAFLLGTESKQLSTFEQDGCAHHGLLLNRISEQTLSSATDRDGSELTTSSNGGEEAAILRTGSKQPSTIKTLEQKECVHDLPLNPISGQTSDGPDRDDSKLTSSNKPSYISITGQDKSISKEDFMALLCLSPTDVVAKFRTCNRHKISKDLHIKSRNIWRKICGEGNIYYSPLVAKAVLRSSKVRVSLERSNLIDRLAFQPVLESINIKNLKSPRPRVPKAASRRKSSIDLCSQKPSSVNVVLKRDSVLDRLALQISNVTCTSCSSNSPGKSTVNPSEAKRTSKAPLSTDTASGLASEKTGCKWLSVNIKRDSSLDMLAQQTSDSTCKLLSSNSSGTCIVSASKATRTSALTLSTDSNIRDSGSGRSTISRKTTNSLLKSRFSNSPGMSIINSSDAKLVSTVSLPTSEIHVKEKPDLKKLSIKINRDLCIDQLALQTSNTTVTDRGSNCNDSSVSHQPDLKLPLDSRICPLRNVPREGMKNLVNRNREGKLRLLPNLEVSEDSKILGPRTGVIKLRRLTSDDWSIIQPDEPGSKSSGSKSTAAESTDSKYATAELTRDPGVSRLARLPTSSSSEPECGFSNKTRSHDSHCANQQNLSAVPSEHIKAPVFRSSAGRSSEDTPKTVSPVSCSNSPKRRTRSALRVEDSHQEWHYNENENPQKHNVSLVKTVTMIEKFPTSRVGKYRVLRESSEKMLGNDLLEEPHTRARGAAPLGFLRRAARLRDHPKNYNLVKPSISSYMSVKKPLGVKSPNHEPTC